MINSSFVFLLSVLALTSANAIELKGQSTQGGMLLGQLSALDKVYLDDQPMRVTSTGYFAFGFGRDAKSRYQLKVVKADGSVQRQIIQVTPRKFNIQRIDGLPKQKVNPTKPAILARIKQDTGQVKKARAIDSELQAFHHPFVWPAAGKITGVYGSQRILNGTPKWPHYGLDIAAASGSLVIAPAEGVVSLAVPDMFYSGGTLIVDHGNGINSTFLHLSRILVEVGQSVKQGEVIAKMGSTGRATGPHLDWRVNWFQVRLDPALLVSGSPPKNLKITTINGQ